MVAQQHRSEKRTVRGIIHGHIQWRNPHGHKRHHHQKQASFLVVTSLDAALKQPHRYLVRCDGEQLPEGVGPGSRVVCHGDLTWHDQVMNEADPEGRSHRTFTLVRATVEHVDVAPPVYARSLSAGQLAMRKELADLYEQLATVQAQLDTYTTLNRALQAHIMVLDPQGAYCRTCGGSAMLDGLCYQCYLVQYQPVALERAPLGHEDADEPPSPRTAGLRY